VQKVAGSSPVFPANVLNGPGIATCFYTKRTSESNALKLIGGDLDTRTPGKTGFVRSGGQWCGWPLFKN
jgi:hypothetical protein